MLCRGGKTIDRAHGDAPHNYTQKRDFRRWLILMLESVSCWRPFFFFIAFQYRGKWRRPYLNSWRSKAANSTKVNFSSGLSCNKGSLEKSDDTPAGQPHKPSKISLNIGMAYGLHQGAINILQNILPQQLRISYIASPVAIGQCAKPRNLRSQLNVNTLQILTWRCYEFRTNPKLMAQKQMKW